MKNREILEEIYYSYVKQKKECMDKISQNDIRIKEINIFLQSVSDSELDRRYFSPIDSDTIFDGRIQSEKELLNQLISENTDLTNTVNDLNLKINQFKEILDEDSSNKNNDIGFNNIKNSFINIQESERNRISSELHDTTIQNLVHIGHSIELASMFVNQDPIRAKLELEGCLKNINNTVDEIRNIIFDLRPMSLDDLEFSKAINDLIDNYKVNYNNVIFELDIDDIDLSHDIKLVLFRIIQECVNNSLKHSKSDRIIIHVKQNDNYCNLIIKDFGIGFDVNTVFNNHFGLLLVKERVNLIGGNIDIDSKEDSGTVISINVPINLE